MEKLQYVCVNVSKQLLRHVFAVILRIFVESFFNDLYLIAYVYPLKIFKQVSNYHRINAKVYTVQIITGSNIVSTTLAFCSRKLFYIPKWNNLYEEKLQTNFFAGSSP